MAPETWHLRFDRLRLYTAPFILVHTLQPGASNMHPYSENTFDTASSLDQAMAAAVSERLAAAVADRGNAFLVVSGGRTPKGFFGALSQAEIPWPRVTVLLADERWAAATSDASNEKLVRSYLLANKAIDARFVSLIPDFTDRYASLTQLNQTLAVLPTFDVVILGMGTDGHTASLFPCCQQLQDGLLTTQPALITEPQSAPHARVSLSKSRLLDTRLGILHTVGEEKRRVLRDAMSDPDPVRAPVTAFLTAETPFEVWHAKAG